MRAPSLCRSVSEYEIESLYNLTILWYTRYEILILVKLRAYVCKLKVVAWTGGEVPSRIPLLS